MGKPNANEDVALLKGKYVNIFYADVKFNYKS